MKSRTFEIVTLPKCSTKFLLNLLESLSRFCSDEEGFREYAESIKLEILHR